MFYCVPYGSMFNMFGGGLFLLPVVAAPAVSLTSYRQGTMTRVSC